MNSAAVIGAGITGLTAAYRLAKQGWQVTVFEAAREVGGLASGYRGGDWDWPLERFYHHLFASDSHMRGLVDEIGFGSRLFFRRPVTAQWWEGKTYPLDSPGAVLRFPGCRWPIAYGSVGRWRIFASCAATGGSWRSPRRQAGAAGRWANARIRPSCALFWRASSASITRK